MKTQYKNTFKLEELDAISKYAESVYMEMYNQEKSDPYKELFSQDDRMTYLGS